MLFNAIAARYERRSVLVTTNLAFSEWPKVFGDDEKLTTALFDRLAHHATVLTTKGKSFRMRQREAPEARTGTRPKASKSGKTGGTTGWSSLERRSASVVAPSGSARIARASSRARGGAAEPVSPRSTSPTTRAEIDAARDV
jgi:hypothetical protein